MKFVKLTNPLGDNVYVCDTWVQIVRGPLKGEHPFSTGCVVILSGERLAVKETVEEVVRLLE